MQVYLNIWQTRNNVKQKHESISISYELSGFAQFMWLPSHKYSAACLSLLVVCEAIYVNYEKVIESRG